MKDIIRVELEIFGIGQKKPLDIGSGRKKAMLVLLDGPEDVFPHPRILGHLSQGNLFGFPLISKIFP
jgi:hypothetical protein